MNSISSTLYERHAFKKRALLATSMLVGWKLVEIIPHKSQNDLIKQSIALKAMMFYFIVVVLKMIKLLLEAYRLNKPVYRHRYSSQISYLIAFYYHLKLEIIYKFVAASCGLYCAYLSYEAYSLDGSILIESSDNFNELESKRINIAFNITKLINYAGFCIFSAGIFTFTILYLWVWFGGPIKFIH
jgi:hypothetical protein